MYVFLTDSEQSTGTDWACEILSRTLDKCWKIAQATKRPWPTVLKVFGDNTPKVLGLCFGEIFGSTQLLTFVFHWPSFHQHWSWESMQGTQKFDIWQVPIYVSNNTCL